MASALDLAMTSTPLLIIILTASCVAGCQSERTDHAAAKAVEEQARTPMPERITSRDGTQIAFSKSGRGPALVIVSGALTSREIGRLEPLVAELSRRFTVYTYDRRGRGDSTDVQPYAVDREIEDIQSLVEHAGS